MINDIDNLIQIFKKYTIKTTKDEMEEQESTGGAPSSSGGGSKPGYPTVTKWESGVTRGPANQIGLTKWSEVNKITRGKANTLL